MSYEPTIWKTGDIVTSEKLNKLENGVRDAGRAFEIDFSADSSTEDDERIYSLELAETAEDIMAMYDSGTPCFVYGSFDGDGAAIGQITAAFSSTYEGETDFTFFVDFGDVKCEFYAESADSFPYGEYQRSDWSNQVSYTGVEMGTGSEMVLQNQAYILLNEYKHGVVCLVGGKVRDPKDDVMRNIMGQIIGISQPVSTGNTLFFVSIFDEIVTFYAPTASSLPSSVKPNDTPAV